MVGLINKKITASTLIEVLIALVIIMVVFAIAIQVFGNVLASGVSFTKIRTQQQLDQLSQTVKTTGYVATPHVQLNEVDYEFLTDTTAVAGVGKLVIKASQNGNLLGSVKCLYQIKPNHEQD